MSPSVRGRRDGFALVIAILGILVLSGLTLASLKTGTDEASAARATRVSASALYAAEAGIHDTQRAWPTTAMELLGPGDSMCLDGSCATGWTTNGSSRYRRVIHRRDDGTAGTQIFSLTSEGRTSGPLGGEATVQVWMTSQIATSSRFTAAIATNNTLTLSGNPIGSRTDSYDSRLGNYCDAAMMALKPTDANYCTTLNAEASGNVHVNTQLLMSGMAHVGGDASVFDLNKSANLGQVTGTVTPLSAKREYPVEMCPATYSNIAGISTCKSGVCSVSLGGVVRTLTTGTYLFHDFVLGNGAELRIPAGNTVNIYLSGELNIGGGAFMNNLGTPSSLNFITCAREAIVKGVTTISYNSKSWTLHGGGHGSRAYFTVYAPTNDVDLTGGSPVYGAIVADDFNASGGAPVHFDRALLAEGAAGATVISLVSPSWSQLLR